MRPDAAAARGAQRLSSGGQRLTRRRSRDRHDPRRPSFPNSGLGTPLRETPFRAPRTSEVLRRQAPKRSFWEDVPKQEFGNEKKQEFGNEKKEGSAKERGGPGAARRETMNPTVTAAGRRRWWRCRWRRAG